MMSWPLFGVPKDKDYYILGLRLGPRFVETTQLRVSAPFSTQLIWGLYWDNGKNNGIYYSILGFIWG